MKIKLLISVIWYFCFVQSPVLAQDSLVIDTTYTLKKIDKERFCRILNEGKEAKENQSDKSVREVQKRRERRAGVNQEEIKEELKDMKEKRQKFAETKYDFALSLLQSEDQSDRLGGVEWLSQINKPKCVDPLLDIIETEKSTEVKRYAIRAVGNILRENEVKLDRILKVFNEKSRDPSIVIQYEIACQLIGLNNISDAIDILFNISFKQHKRFKDDLNVWINEEVDRPDLSLETQEMLAKKLQENLPINAMDQLVKIGTMKVLDKLNENKNNPDEWIRQSVEIILNRINESED